MSSGWKTIPGKLDVAEASGWTLRVVNALRNPLVAWTHYHPAVGQILTTKMPPLSHFPEFVKESRESKVNQRDSQCLNLILALVDRGAYDESLRITVDLLELIEDCTVGCQLSHWSAGSLKSRILRLFKSWHHYDVTDIKRKGEGVLGWKGVVSPFTWSSPILALSSESLSWFVVVLLLVGLW